MKITIKCSQCNFKLEGDLKKGAVLTPKDLENMAHFFGFEVLSNGYICENCKEKQGERNG